MHITVACLQTPSRRHDGSRRPVYPPLLFFGARSTWQVRSSSQYGAGESGRRDVTSSTASSASRRRRTQRAPREKLCRRTRVCHCLLASRAPHFPRGPSVVHHTCLPFPSTTPNKFSLHNSNKIYPPPPGAVLASAVAAALLVYWSSPPSSKTRTRCTFRPALSAACPRWGWCGASSTLS